MACVRKRRGKWVVDYRDALGKRRWVTVEGNREAAEEELARIIRSGKQPLNIKQTFQEYAESWLSTYGKTNLKPSTYQEYESSLNKHAYPVRGSKPFTKISREAMKALIAEKRSAGLSRSTVRNIVAPIRCMNNSAIDDGALTFNPASRLGKFNKRNAEDKKINPLTREELATFLKETQGQMPHWYPLFLCASRTGVREGELIALRPADVDFNGRFIDVQWNFSRGEIVRPKNNKTRRVDMSTQLTNTLDQLVAKKKADALRDELKKPQEQHRKREDVIAEVMEGPLFTTPTGERLDPSNLRKVFWNMLAKAKLRRVRFHDLRHSFGSLLIAQGESLAYIKDQLGHSSIKITVDTYGHLVPGGNRQAVDRLDDVPGGNSQDQGVTGSEMVAAPSGRKTGMCEGLKSLRNLARPEGFEPPTPRSVVWCSVQLSYGRERKMAEREGFEPSVPF
jgi:integrase